MTRIHMMFLAGGVWLLAASSAAALTVDLTRPLTPRDSTPEEAGLVHTATPPPIRTLGAERPVLRLPPTTIVAHARRPLGQQPPAALKPLPDISRMNCAPWRDLQMGSGRVQTCE